MRIRRIVSILLVICLVCGLCVPGVAAAENKKVEIIDSGKCGAFGKGNDVSWTLDSNGLLTVSGTGEMKDNFPGWKNHEDKITSVVVEEGVTSIGAAAFRNCRKITKATLPASLTSIGSRAFSSCTGMTEVIIPAGVSHIAERAFFACEKLGKLAIPNSVTYIGDYAFAVCSALTSFAAPNSVRSIGEGVFSTCSNLSSVSIPNSVTSIGASAFQGCSNLKNVRIPESVSKIGIGAFEKSGLQHIVFLGAAPDMDKEALYGVTAKAYYHASAATWSEQARHGYGGELTWEEICTLEITGQPTNGYAGLGAMAKVEVQTKGNSISYVWYYKDPGTSQFKKTQKFWGPTYEIEMNNQRNGRQVYCEMKDIHGKSAKTDVVTLVMGATVVEQPKNVTAKKDTVAETSVKAIGEELTYTWYHKPPNASRFFEDRTCRDASYELKMSKKTTGTEVYCIVTDKYGNKVQTETVTLKMK